MANLQLLEYMKTQMKNGFKKDDLLAAVRKAGWQEPAIQEVLREMEPARPIAIPPIKPAVQTVSVPAIGAAKPIPAQPAYTPVMPTKPAAMKPIAIDASGNTVPRINPLPQASSAVTTTGAEAAFGTQQLPQMRKPLPQGSERPAPIFKKSEFAQFANENSGYSQPPKTAPAVVEQSTPPASAPIAASSAPMPAREQLQNIAPHIIAQNAKPAAIPLYDIQPAPLRMNPAFIPGASTAQPARPLPSAPALPELQTRLTPASGIPLDIEAQIRKPASAAPVNSSPTPGAFQGMRPNAPQSFGAQTFAAPRISSTGILPASRPILIPQQTAAMTQPKQKSHKLLWTLFILLFIAGGGAFAYFQFPASVQQAQDSIQALIPSNTPTPGAILSSALAKLFATSQLSFTANIAGSVTSAQDSSSDIHLQGTVSGSLASIVPFPVSKDALVLSVTQARQSTPAFSTKADLLTTSGQGIFFRFTDISGTQNAGGAYDGLKNVWISVDPSQAGLSGFSAIFGSPQFQAHKDDIANIVIHSQIFAVAAAYNDDPGSGLYHYGIAIQKQNILPAAIQIAQVIGASVTDDQKAAISDSLASANFPGFEIWINKESQTVSRIRMNISKGTGNVQAFSFDVSLAPLIGNVPEILPPDGAIPLDQALGGGAEPVATTTAPAARPVKKK